MKKIHLFSFALILTFLASSCVKDQCKQDITYTKYTPIYHSFEEINAEITNASPRALENPGKIYFYQDYIFINEKREGIHIIDNSDPNDPQPVSFIPIGGNVDMAVKNNRMYADHYNDLITLDISDIRQVRLLDREEEVFRNYNSDENGIVVDYDQEEITEEIDCNYNPNINWGRFSTSEDLFNADIAFANNSSGLILTSPTSGIVGGSVGVGGSFARFSLYDDYLYVVETFSIRVFDITQLDQPSELQAVDPQIRAETAYNYRDHLFIGGTSGMNIFDLSNPATPVFASGYTHQTGCDPVAVFGDYAYVTIREGRSCQGTINQLDVLDITNIRNPILKSSFPMENPHGLSVTEESLFLCEGDQGLKVFDNDNPLQVGNHQLSHLDNFEAYDVINLPTHEDVLLLIGADGFFQFDVSNPEQPVEISHIPVVVR